jgi:uncharacterized alpha-E superfamily protein
MTIKNIMLEQLNPGSIKDTITSLKTQLEQLQKQTDTDDNTKVLLQKQNQQLTQQLKQLMMQLQIQQKQGVGSTRKVQTPLEKNAQNQQQAQVKV